MKYYLGSRVFVITPGLQELKRLSKGKRNCILRIHENKFFRDSGDRIENKRKREKNALFRGFKRTFHS